MKDDTELRVDDDWQDDDIDSPGQIRTGSGRGKLLSVLVGILIVVVLGAGIFYFITKRPSGGDENLIRMKMAAFEEKISSLERQIADLQGKPGPAGPGPDPALLQRIEALAHKVEGLEKRPQPPTNTEAKPPAHKPAAPAEKRYHRVLRGETLSMISRTYGTTPEKLRKLNNLSSDQDIRPGQKLLVSSRK